MFKFLFFLLVWLTPYLASSQLIRCPSLAVYQKNYEVCLMAAGLLVDWDSAENLCNYQGGHLFGVADDEKNTYLIKFINTFGENHNYFYFGYQYRQSQWHCSNSRPTTYSNFQDDRTPNENDVAWIYANRTAENSGRWYSGEGNTARPFLCEIPPCSAGRQLTADINGTYIRYDSEYQKYYFGNNLIMGNYKKAKQECERLSSFLPDIQDEDENESVRNILRELLPGVQQAWLGLTYDNTGKWQWPRSNSTFTNWAPGEPSLETTSVGAVISLESGLWKTISTAEEQYLICSGFKSRKLC